MNLDRLRCQGSEEVRGGIVAAFGQGEIGKGYYESLTLSEAEAGRLAFEAAAAKATAEAAKKRGF